MKKFVCLIAVWLLLAWITPVFAGSIALLPLGVAEAAINGATHMVNVTYDDLDETTTNTAETLTFSVAAKTSVELVGFRLNTAFDTGNTNYTGSLALTVGDGTDADLYLTSTELASDGSEVWAKFGNSAPTTSITYFDPTDSSTNTVTLGVAALGRKVYTAADTVDLVLTPNAEEATGSNTSGSFDLFFRIRK